MTIQQEQTMLTMLRVDLGISTHAYDSRLGEYIKSAANLIGTEGITLNLNSVEDAQLVVMYAAWMWRKRDYSEEAGMPRMIRYILNNRLFSEKVKANG